MRLSGNVLSSADVCLDFGATKRCPLAATKHRIAVPPSPRDNAKVQVCAGGGVDALTLSSIEQPDATFYPNLLEGDLLLSLAPSSPSDTTSGTEDQSTTAASKSCSGTAGRVAWRVSGLWSSPSDSISTQEQDDWTVFPSTGLLLPGEK